MIKKFCKGNDSAFARAIGVTPSVVGNITGVRAGSPSFEVLQKIINAFEYINIEWLLTGKGEMLKNDNSAKSDNADNTLLLSLLERERLENSKLHEKIGALHNELEHFKNENTELRNAIHS